MNSSPLFYKSEKLARTQPRIVQLSWEITGAKTVSPLVQGMPALAAFDAISAQSVIDSFLSSSDYTSANEFLLAAFDATSMGADAFGAIVNMDRQVQDVLYMNARCYSGTGGATLVERSVKASSALTATTLATELAKSSAGNLAFKVDFGNTPDFDALTAGLIIVDIAWISK